MAAVARDRDAGGAPAGAALRFTMGFLVRGGRTLLLHRRFPPNQGLWNGPGGRIEPGEDPLAALLREMEEETGAVPVDPRPAGTVRWRVDGRDAGGMHVFVARRWRGRTRRECPEGRLAWWPLAEIWRSPHVVSNIPLFLPPMLDGDGRVDAFFEYRAGRMTAHRVERA